MSYNESLKPNSNYPKMSQSEWDNAPFNEIPTPERDFDIDVEFVMRKATTVTTSDYAREYDDEDGREYANTENTDWERAYSDSGHYTIPELIEELKQYVLKDLQSCSPNTCKGASLKRLLESCDGWVVEEKTFEY